MDEGKLEETASRSGIAGTAAMTEEPIENRRKRLIFRSWHRGTREMDIIMGSFADANVPGFDDAQLMQYEEILNHPDPDVYDWVAGRTPVPANFMNAVMGKLLEHRPHRSGCEG